MAKLDLSNLTRGVDEAIKNAAKPLHRRILEVYRHHMLLELTGRFEEIFSPDIMVEHPVYWINAPISLRSETSTQVFDGRADVMGFYGALTDNDALVMVHEKEALSVADWGLASESLLHHQIPGRNLRSMGFEIDDEGATYLLSYYIVAIWHFDRQGRLTGEHLYQAAPESYELTKLAPHEVTSPEEAREYYTSLIRPLSPFEGSA